MGADDAGDEATGVDVSTEMDVDRAASAGYARVEMQLAIREDFGTGNGLKRVVTIDRSGALHQVKFPRIPTAICWLFGGVQATVVGEPEGSSGNVNSAVSIKTDQDISLRSLQKVRESMEASSRIRPQLKRSIELFSGWI